ncbi:MAG: hypothetical protein QNJ54_07210 [Prochloraceae cyanobacterium]|nr:hypothetical protein [Prochloraceae cyanobacterium]
MSNNDILIEDSSDFFICKAFHEIITAGKELENKLGNQARLAIANYLVKIPSEEYEDPSAIANRITAFSQRSSGNKRLNEWLGKIYDRLDETGIEKILKKTGDPGEEAEEDPKMTTNISNEARDICKDIERCAKEERDNNNQSDRNDSN